MGRTVRERTRILYPHNRVHQSKMWHYHVHSSLANAASQGLAIKTGEEQVHLNFDVAAAGSARVRLYEGPTVSACTEGTSPMNMNRYKAGSGAAAECSVQIGASPDVASTAWNQLLAEHHIPGGGKKEPEGGIIKTGAEWILNQSKTYTIGATNLQGTTGGVTIAVEFYED